MTSDQLQIINDLKSSVNTLIAKLEREKEEQERLRVTNQELQRRVNMQEAMMGEIEQKYSNLKIAKALVAESGGMHDARIKVNKIVREIDKCIALLNR
jgi:predicted nuclease with TOPRIM domain